MTAAWRPPTAYVHGIGGSVVVVPGRVAAWLERHADLRRLRTDARGADAEVDAVLVALATCAFAWRASATGTAIPAQAEPVALSSWLSTSQAAGLVGVTPRAIRKAIADDRLSATEVNGSYRISREDVEHFRAGRAA